jgi:vacuolar protein 8
LVDLARSKDKRVQRNATGALLNMTHSRKNDGHKYIMHSLALMFNLEENRQQLVNANAIPVLTGLLNSDDQDVQYYCTTALSNIAVDGE